jgi:drug/metabolite transporter (DMT)-like permease
LITVSNNIGDNNHIIGVLLSLGAAVLYATVVMLNKQVKGVSGLHRTIIQFIGALIILMPYVIISTGFQILDISKEGLISLLIIGVIHTGIAYCLYFTSVKNLTGQNVAILSYIDPVVAVMASVLILKEDITIIQIIGGVIIIGFTLYNELVTVKINKEINNENKSNS